MTVFSIQIYRYILFVLAILIIKLFDSTSNLKTGLQIHTQSAHPAHLQARSI